MFIDLVDDLRCPQPHEETWLVVASDRTHGRNIMEGTLGCPICRSEYAIRRGVVWFRDPAAARPAPPVAQPARADVAVAMRLAALLDLSDPGGFALLSGSWAVHARAVRELVETQLVVLNPASAVAAGDGISVVETAGPEIPVAQATLRGVALDAVHADAASLEAAVRVLRPRGRLLAPVAAALPAGAIELARDGELWVAEREPGGPKLVRITRGAPGPHAP